MTVQIQFGVPKNQRRKIAKIYYEAFKDKLGRIFSNKQKAETLISRSLRDDRILVACKDGVAVGFAGLQYQGKKFVDPSLTQVARIYGLETIRGMLFFFFSMFNKPKPNQLYLEMLAVSEDQRNKGIGTKLIQSTINHARSKKIPQIKLEVVDTNPKAKKLYERIGFEKAKDHKIPYPFNTLIGFRIITEMHYNI